MAETTPEPQDSAAAEARKTIDALKAEVAELKAQNATLGQVRHVERFVRGKGINDDTVVDQWVDTMMPTAGTISFESQEQFATALNERFGGLIQPPVAAPSEPPPPPPAEGVTPPAPQAPATPENTPTFATPNPGTPGQPPQQQVYEFGDPYIQGLLRQGAAGVQQVKALYENKQVRGHPISERYGDPVSS